ncbi:sigma-70 family RNA polymerase sigma factor [Kytococcus sp. Marseille-QA3725]
MGAAPRRVQELATEVRIAEDELRHRDGTEPSREQVAAWLGTTPQEVDEARMAAAGRFTDPVEGEEPSGASMRHASWISVDEWLTVQPHVEALDPRDREVLLRYFHDETQAQVASALGISQAQVSRRNGRGLKVLRERVTDGARG